jgi:hypothetical protein
MEKAAHSGQRGEVYTLSTSLNETHQQLSAFEIFNSRSPSLIYRASVYIFIWVIFRFHGPEALKTLVSLLTTFFWVSFSMFLALVFPTSQIERFFHTSFQRHSSICSACQECIQRGRCVVP